MILTISKTRCSAIAETALQGALVLAKNGKLELGDSILRTLG